MLAVVWVRPVIHPPTRKSGAQSNGSLRTFWVSETLDIKHLFRQLGSMVCVVLGRIRALVKPG